MLEITVAVPPSANVMWRFPKGADHPIKSREYRAWQQETLYRMRRPDHPITEDVSVKYFIPKGLKRDLDNSLKPVGDILEAGGILKNDRQIRRMAVDVEDRSDIRIIVEAL